MDLGFQLKKYREQAGYTQAKEFAEKLGIPYTRYVAYENKGVEPKLDVLCKIAHTLNVTIDELLGQERFERCKRKVESTHTMTVTEKEDGTVEVTFSYDKEVVKRLMQKIKAMRLDDESRPPLGKGIKIYTCKEDFCKQVELANAKFDSNVKHMEEWEKLFDGIYFENLYARAFNERSCIQLEAWQIKSISSCMQNELTDNDPAKRTPEKIEEYKKNLDKHFANYRVYGTNDKVTRRIPPGYDDLLDE